GQDRQRPGIPLVLARQHEALCHGIGNERRRRHRSRGDERCLALQDRDRPVRRWDTEGSMKKAAVASAAVLLLGLGLVAQGQPRVAPEIYSRLHWRFVGPEDTRISAVAGVPGDPLVYYAGSASGGIAKTTDGGVHWQQVFDDQPVRSNSALSICPSAPH